MKKLFILITVLSISLCSVIVCPNVAFAQDVSPEPPAPELSDDSTSVTTALEEESAPNDVVPQAVTECPGVGATGWGVPNVQISLGNNKTINDIDNGSKDTRYDVTSVKIGSNSFDPGDTANVGPIEIKGRGNATWSAPKKPYQIKFDKKQSIDGMGKAKKWVLLANYYDPAGGIRNDLGSKLANDLGMPYQDDSEHVNLYVNCEYRGSYTLGEKNEAGKAADNHGVDLTDNYGILIEHDPGSKEANDLCQQSNAGDRLCISDSKADDHATVDSKTDDAMAEFMKSYNDLLTAAQSKNWTTVQNLTDVGSFAEHILTSNFLAQGDGLDGSFFMYKNGASDKIHAGPVWDFDISANNYNHPAYQYSPTDNIWNKRHIITIAQYLVNIPEFQALMNQIKISHKSAFTALPDYIDSQYSQIANSLDANYSVWPITTFLPNIAFASTWQNVQSLKSFIKSRICGLEIDDSYCAHPIPIYRAAKYQGGYFYTSSFSEYLSAANFDMRLEGIAFYAPVPGTPGAVPVYRSAKLNGSGYFYTISEYEHSTTPANNMRQEGQDFWAFPANMPGMTTVYRGAHLVNQGYIYTSDVNEYNNSLPQFNYRQEGAVFSVY